MKIVNIMKTKLLKQARERFQIDHVHHPYLMWRVMELTSKEIIPMTHYGYDLKSVTAIRRLLILQYCRSKIHHP